MHLLMINYEFPPIGGGAGRAHEHLLGEYAKRDDLRVDVVTAGLRPGLEKMDFGARAVLWKVGLHKKALHHWRKAEVLEWLWKAGPVVRRLCRENRYDLVHVISGFPSGWFSWRVHKRLPGIVSLRGSDVPGMNVRLALDYKVLAPLFRKIWRSADLLVANSEGLRQRALRFLPDVAIEVIPNGVDLQAFAPLSDRSDFSGRLLTVGRLTPTKRVEILLEAVVNLRQEQREVSLTIVGDGPQRETLEALAAQKGLAGDVHFVGRAEAAQMPTVYREHDLYVSATCQEGMSNAMLEALACGLPLVSTPCEGLDELLCDNGVVVEPATAGGLAGAVRDLMDDPHRYAKLAEQARRHAASLSWANAAQAYLRCYERVLSKGPGN